MRPWERGWIKERRDREEATDTGLFAKPHHAWETKGLLKARKRPG